MADTICTVCSAEKPLIKNPQEESKFEYDPSSQHKIVSKDSRLLSPKFGNESKIEVVESPKSELSYPNDDSFINTNALKDDDWSWLLQHLMILRQQFREHRPTDVTRRSRQ